MATRLYSHQHYQIQMQEMEPVEQPPSPDLTDFMNDWFFGAVDAERRRSYNLRGGGGEGNMNRTGKEVLRGRRSVTTSSTSRLTQEWLEQAKRMVAESPTSTCHSSTARSTSGTPRFVAVASQAKEPSPSPSLDKRDPLSRSARRNRNNLESIGDEILQRSSARHNRNRSETNLVAAGNSSSSPAGQWSSSSPFDESDADTFITARHLPPKLPNNRRSRFLEETPDIAPPRRSFRTPSPSTRHPPPLLTENAPHQQPPPPPLSPPRNLLESAHRRSISSSTCSIDKVSGYRRSFSGERMAEVEKQEDVKQINLFLRRQRAMVARIADGEVSASARIVLSSYKPNTSSMVAAICYAWLLENTREEKVVVPVLNIRRASMWDHKQAAWIFHHLGIDASALMFFDELDLEGLLMGRQLSFLVVGQDVLQTNGEVGSPCTILADNYCEDAYNLLQTPILKRLLLAGILLDTQNLNGHTKLCTNRDSEAVQLLLVGSSPNYRDLFFEQVMQDHGEESFLEAMREHYGKLSSEAKQKPSSNLLVARPTPALLKESEKALRGKNKFSLGKLFGFGSK